MFAWNILKVALGLGFVIFLHELGHFLLAKWNGVKVEKFSIGFGPTLASFRRGVGLRIGTGSRPPGRATRRPGARPSTSWPPSRWAATSRCSARTRRSGPTRPRSRPTPGPSTTSRSGPGWQIISAGVIMNVLLGSPASPSSTRQGGHRAARPRSAASCAGSPAYKAGLRAGDEIVAIDGRRDVGFKDLLSPGQPQRRRAEGPVHRPSGPARRPSTTSRSSRPATTARPMPTIGIRPASSLELRPRTPFRALPGQDVDKARPDAAASRADDTVVAVGPEGGRSSRWPTTTTSSARPSRSATGRSSSRSSGRTPKARPRRRRPAAKVDRPAPPLRRLRPPADARADRRDPARLARREGRVPRRGPDRRRRRPTRLRPDAPARRRPGRRPASR